ncbi:FtsK/SpoIIIE domain-containing protein [Paenibacillus graminis]|uniref:FtsK/SpoIIIE domain-containing protein n=1 Tax=Paenibacillus graminis TaxID=189425 RepID=UPI002DBE2C09|nr:FtsK/SpoIIIE domain-containing protein [Paenibacillus graminis]MEC0167378.1 FtsK/SpoIIIE domain-containing protein [Paenibacillus graminis]
MNETKPTKESFSQFVSRVAGFAAGISVLVILLDMPEVQPLAWSVLQYAVTLWVCIVGIPSGARLLWKHKLHVIKGAVIIHEAFGQRKLGQLNQLWTWKTGQKPEQAALPATHEVGAVMSVCLPPIDQQNGKEVQNGAVKGSLPMATGPFALLPLNPRPQPSSTLSKEFASEKIFNAIQLAGLKMEEPPEVLAIDSGPTLQTISFKLPAGLQLSQLIKKRDDLANHLGYDQGFSVTSSSFPSAAAFVIPHDKRAFVYLSDMIAELQAFAKSAQLPLVYGKDMEGKPLLVDLAKLPHLLVAGATGSGKSVFINDLLASLTTLRSPKEVRLLLIDPKMVEFTIYAGLPHLITPPVADPKRAALALRKMVVEMEKRYECFSKVGARNILHYNRKHPEELLPHMVCVIDEYADLMLVAGGDVEDAVQRLTQLGRAAGLHIIMGTQRPSTDVVTGVIKANLPSRVAFQLKSVYDFRTVMDCSGPHLLGGGDGVSMLNGGKLIRFQSAAISADDEEMTQFIEQLIEYWKEWEAKHHAPPVEPAKSQAIVEEDEPEPEEPAETEGEEPRDVDEWTAADDSEELPQELYARAVQVARSHGGVSGTVLQQKLGVDYLTAANLIQRMSDEGKLSQEFDFEKKMRLWLDDSPRSSDEELLERMKKNICEKRSARSSELQQALGIRKEKVLQLMGVLVEEGFLLSPESLKSGYIPAWDEEQMEAYLSEKYEV